MCPTNAKFECSTPAGLIGNHGTPFTSVHSGLVPYLLHSSHASNPASHQNWAV